MRAKTVRMKAYIFDFDDTLVKTQAKVHVYTNNKRIKSITPSEYNFYKLRPQETFNMSDFTDPRMILSATKYKLWPALKNISDARKMGRSNSDIYILTARCNKAQQPIHTFLSREGIDIPLDNVMTIGGDDKVVDIAEEKRIVLSALVDEYTDVYFFDDNEENIELANKIPGIKTRLVDWNK